MNVRASVFRYSMTVKNSICYVKNNGSLNLLETYWQFYGQHTGQHTGLSDNILAKINTLLNIYDGLAIQWA